MKEWNFHFVNIPAFLIGVSARERERGKHQSGVILISFIEPPYDLHMDNSILAVIYSATHESRKNYIVNNIFFSQILLIIAQINFVTVLYKSI